MSSQSHMVRNAALIACALVALFVAAALLEGGALAIIAAMLVLGAAVVVLPFVVIHFDEHEERLDHRGLGTHR